jgi:hypothetical protein
MASFQFVLLMPIRITLRASKRREAVSRLPKALGFFGNDERRRANDLRLPQTTAASRRLGSVQFGLRPTTAKSAVSARGYSTAAATTERGPPRLDTTCGAFKLLEILV